MSLSSKELLERMPPLVDGMKFILDSNSKAEVQIADINHLCWTMVELCVKVQEAVHYELSDRERGLRRAALNSLT